MESQKPTDQVNPSELQPTETPGKTPSMEDFKGLKNIMYAALLVLGLGFITLIINYFESSRQAFEALKTEVAKKNDLIDTQAKVINDIQNQQPQKQTPVVNNYYQR